MTVVSPRSRARRAAPIFALLTGLVVSSVGLAAPASATDGSPVIDRLTVNGRVAPLGIGSSAPSFGWAASSTERGVVQSAYQVRVATADAGFDAPVWDSGKVSSAAQVDVVYGGPELDSQTRYLWQVRTWDGADAASEWSEPAAFETGLESAEDWGGAEWIGDAGGAELSRWTDYTASFDFTLDNLVFATFIRTADLGNGYMWQVKAVGDEVQFRPHRKVNGNFALIESKDISSVISADELRTGEHTLDVEVDGDTLTTSLDGEVIDTRTDATFDKGYVGFRSSVATEGTEAATVHRVTVTAEGGDVLLDTAFADGNPFSGGTLVDGGLQISGNVEALWKSPDDHKPLVRTEFTTEAGKQIASARAYATARGIYQLQLNGEKVGDQHLAPGWTDYDDRFQSQTYDITDQVVEGDNAFGAMLADGWWAGKVGMWGPGVYGNDLSLIARIRIDYTDGSSQWVDSSDAWTGHSGPYTFADNIDGETYDARLEQPGWDTVGFDDGDWTAVATVDAPEAPIVPQPDEPVRTTQELDVIERTTPGGGATIYDVGQNMVGVVRVNLTGEAGDTVRIRYGEMLNEDGTLYTANLRAAKVTDYYTFAEDGTVTYEPVFTQHGFRYVEITGLETAPAAADLTGVVWGSDLPDTGTLTTSDAMLNQLLSNISWGQRGNFLSIPTDTPARDERLGWTGDINVFAPTASYLTDTRAFLTKWMQDMEDAQYENGDFPGIAPLPKNVGCCGGGTAWADAGITVPYALWRSYGDATAIREFYPQMVAFFDYVQGSAGADLIDSDRNVYGDWLNLDDNTPVGVIGTAYYAEDARMLSEMAAAIGESEDAETYAQVSEDVRAAFAEAFIAEDGTVQGNNQTGYALALGMDLVPAEQRDAVGAKFAAKLAASGNHLTTGFVGTPWLLPALSSIGRDDLAYMLLMREEYPSWGYEVAMGATTMWERWNSLMPDGSFGDVGMNSFNHYAYGAVGDWMYQNIGAISAIEPGYKAIRIAPEIGGGITSAQGTLQSVYGEIATDWTLTGDDLSLTVDVPVNTTAEVVLPAGNAWAVTESGRLLDEVEGVTGVVAADGEVTVSIGSGHYEFAVTAGAERLGAVLDLVAAADAVVASIDAGDIADGDRTALTEGLAAIGSQVRAALLASIDGDTETTVASLQDALTSVQDLAAWLAASDIDAPVRGQVSRALAPIEAALQSAATRALGVRVGLAPIAEAVLAGDTASGVLEIANDGDSAVTALTGTVAVSGWGSTPVTAARVAAGASLQLPVMLDVPVEAAPGAVSAAVSVTFTIDDREYTVTDATAGWARVASGLELGAPTLATGDADPSEQGTITVPVVNGGDAAVRVQIAAALPDGWGTVPSAPVRVAAGESVDVAVPVTVPLAVVGGDVPVTVQALRNGTVLAEDDTTVTLDLATPPADATDHVDFGDGASESAHGIQASAHSGTNTEAGLTRRYAHSSYPGGWYSVEVDVPEAQPYVLRGIETFDGARTKRYEIRVDGEVATVQYVPRAVGGVGTIVWDAVIDDPALLSEDGTARIEFRYPEQGSSGYFDPSIADLWVLPAEADDTLAPIVSGEVTAGVGGAGGWYRSDVTVAVRAADARDGAPVVQVGESAGWQPYSAPVTVTAEGEQVLSYRATDAAGNRAAGSLPVRIDRTAPASKLVVDRGVDPADLDQASLTLTASDALSGVAQIAYRIDGGAWSLVGEEPISVTGFGEHIVDYAATDVAGNVESLRSTTVLLSDVTALHAVVAPQVTGTARVGSLLSSTVGSWNTTDVATSRQWLRNGVPISGATGASYRLKSLDVGKRVSLQVTATKEGVAPGTAVSAPTATVQKAISAVSLRLDRSRVSTKGSVKVIATVTSSIGTPTGSVEVRVDGKRVKVVSLKNGTATTSLTISKAGNRAVSVRYLGSAELLTAMSQPVRITVVKR